jgi:hypothetical protein
MLEALAVANSYFRKQPSVRLYPIADSSCRLYRFYRSKKLVPVRTQIFSLLSPLCLPASFVSSYPTKHQPSYTLLEKLTVPQLVKKFPAFYGIRKFVTAFTNAWRLFLSRARPHESSSHFLYILFIPLLIYPFYPTSYISFLSHFLYILFIPFLIYPFYPTSYISFLSHFLYILFIPFLIYPFYSTSYISFIILFSHLHIGLPSGLFPSRLPNKTLYAPRTSTIRATFPCPSHSSSFEYPNRIWYTASITHAQCSQNVSTPLQFHSPCLHTL